MGGAGNGNGQLQYPSDVAVDPWGNIYVADYGNHQIQKFTIYGLFLTRWGANGSVIGQFLFPRGVSVDSLGYVYVADSSTNRIQMFSRSGGVPLTK